jgi:hypothetical protein
LLSFNIFFKLDLIFFLKPITLSFLAKKEGEKGHFVLSNLVAIYIWLVKIANVLNELLIFKLRTNKANKFIHEN